MTIAHLMVKLSADAASLHMELERAARRVERTGRTFAKIGREISTAISLPLIAGAFGAFQLLLQESTRHFGLLFRAVESVKGEFRNLFLALARELEPTFLQIIALLRGGIATLRSWVAAFHDLPEPVRKAVIFTLAFLAALGPTLFVVGKIITAIGALGRILPLLITPIGLAVVAVSALAAAAIYVVTHWEWAQLRLALAWAFIKDVVFTSVHAILVGLGNLVEGAANVARAYSGMPGLFGAGFRALELAVGPAAESIRKLTERFDALADESLAKSAAQILKLEEALKRAKGPAVTFTNTSTAITEALKDMNAALQMVHRQTEVFGPTFNQAAATMQVLRTTIQRLLDAGVDPLHPALVTLRSDLDIATEGTRLFDQVLGAFGPRLEQQLRAIALFHSLIAAGVKPQMAAVAVSAEAKLILTVMQGLEDALTLIAERIGNIFAGVSRGFRGFAAELGRLIGTVMKQIGQTLIQMGATAIMMGVLGKAIKFFAKNPVAAIAAGAALIALGQALGAASERHLAQGFGGEGGGGSAVSSSGASVSTQGPTELVLRLETPDGLIATLFKDPRNQDAMAALLEELTGRRVITEVRDAD